MDTLRFLESKGGEYFFRIGKGKEIWFGRVRLWIFPRVLEMKIEEKIGRGMLLVFLIV